MTRAIIVSVRLWNPGILRKPSMPTITQNRCLGNIPLFYDYSSFLFTFNFHTFPTAYFCCLLVFSHIYCLYLSFSLSISVFVKGYRLVAESLPFKSFYPENVLKFLIYNMLHPGYSSMFTIYISSTIINFTNHSLKSFFKLKIVFSNRKKFLNRYLDFLVPFI